MTEEELKEAKEEKRCETTAAALRSPPVSWIPASFNNRLIRLILSALVKNTRAPRRFEHYRIPGLPSGTPKQCDEGLRESLKVHMIAHLAMEPRLRTLQVNDREKLDRNHSECVEEKK